MAISKVVYKSSASAQGVTWIDATPATAAAADIISPKTAMLADGVVTQGTGSGGITPTGNINITQAGETDVTNYATATVASGTEGTPTATKGSVSNHSVSVTPSVTNTAGYITGSTKTGTAVSVSASELVSGTYTVDSSGTKDVTNYASASVPAGTAGTPSATKGTVSNHSVSVTPSVTNTEGWITGSTKTGTAVTVSASELVSGNKEILANDTNIDVVDYSTVSVAVPNTYSVSDEGKVVSNGALVSQSSDTVTQNGPVDTTLISSLLVNVAASGGLDYVKSTVTMVRNHAAIIDREFENFVLIAYLKDAPTDMPANNYVAGTTFIYAEGDFWQPSATTSLRSNGTSILSATQSPSQLVVSETSIALSLFSTSNNVAGEWVVLQIEIPSDSGIYNWRTVNSDLTGGN